MSKFDLAFIEIMKRETPWRSNGGKITFLPKVTSDTGGLTKWGISQKAYPDLDIQNLTFDGAKNLYITRWNDSKAGLIASQKTANIYFDHAVNAGLSSAIDVIRRALVWLGGRISSKPSLNELIEEANRYPTNLPAAIAKFRKLHYENLIEKNPKKYGMFADEWEARVNSFFPHQPLK